MTKKILVTGASGFLGSHLVASLLAAGGQVRCLNRAAVDELVAAGAEHCRGSVLSVTDVEEAMEGCDRVYHLAGRVSRDPRDRAALFELHLEGSRNVVHAASKAGVKRVVYASTSGAIACSKDPEHIATEADPYPINTVSGWPYYVSKIEAEKLACRLAHDLGVELVCINPSLLLGPGDTRMSSTEDVIKLMQRKVPAIPSGGLSFVDVRDVADAAIGAMERGRPGERYLLGACNWPLRRFIEETCRQAGVKAPRLPAPDRLTRLAAGLVEPLFRAVGKTPPLDVVSAEMSQVFWYFDSAKAQREIGFSPRDPAETLVDTITDLRQRAVV